MVKGAMLKNLAVPSPSTMLRLIGIVWLIGANCNWEAIALSSIDEGSGKEQQLFKGDESRIPQTSSPPNLLSLANFSSPYTYARVRLVSTGPPALLIKAKGMKIEASTANETNAEEEQVPNCGWKGEEPEEVEVEDWDQVAKKRDGHGGKGEIESATMRRKFFKNILKNRIGPLMSMLPFMMQMWSLPGAMASIKMSLLKSIFVAKLAFLMLFFTFLRSYQKSSEVVIVHKTQQHQHYYHEYQRLEDENDVETSWWKK